MIGIQVKRLAVTFHGERVLRSVADQPEKIPGLGRSRIQTDVRLANGSSFFEFSLIGQPVRLRQIWPGFRRGFIFWSPARSGRSRLAYRARACVKVTSGRLRLREGHSLRSCQAG